MNHTKTVLSVSSQLSLRNNLSYTGIPFILGETNSLYNQGKPGLSNSFGAALWVVDFNLHCAANSIKRVHMHQGTNYRYQSWQPITTSLDPIGTKAPYYGNIAVAAFLGNLEHRQVQIKGLDLGPHADAGVRESAYAAYEHGKLKRVIAINMREYNYTINGTSSIPNPIGRPSTMYEFAVGDLKGRRVQVQRLWANGSDAITGVTWDGWSYNYELKRGIPVRLHNVTIGESGRVKNGVVKIEVPDSSAAVLRF